MLSRELIYFGILGCLLAGATRAIKNHAATRVEKAMQRRQIQDWENEGGAIATGGRAAADPAQDGPVST